MKTLRPYTLLVLSALTILSPPDSVWAAPPEAFLSEADADGQVSGNLSNSRAGLMTLQGLTGRNELTYGALPSVGLWGNWGDNYYNNQDYYTLDAFLPWNLNPGTDYFFSQLGITFTENGRVAGAGGAGYAYYLSDWDRLLRTSGWFFVDGQFSQTRMALGLYGENLGKYVDVRSSVQFVTSDSEDFLGTVVTGPGRFTGNQFQRSGYSLTETAYNNANLEIGGPLAYLGDYGISAYARAYFLLNNQVNDDAVGVGVRGEWAITEDITFNVNHTRDDIFDSSTWFNLILTTPDGAPRNCARPISVRERFSKRVYTDGRIPTKLERSPVNVAAVNPKTGSAFTFVWVNPNRATDGNGTRENPYNMLESARLANNAGVDVIAVIPDTTNMDPGINLAVTQSFQLFNNQYFLGTSVDHVIPTTNIGNIFIPGSGDPGPFIHNSSDVPDSVVTLANWNTVSGFIIDGRDPDDNIIHDGIVGTGISGFDINRNTIQNVVNGTLITHVGTDVGFFDDNIVTGGGNNSTRGFSITHTGGTLDLSVQRNDISGFLGEDLDADGMLDPGEDLIPNGVLDFGVGIEIIAGTGGTIDAWDPLVLGVPAPIPPAVLPDPMFGILDNVSSGNGTGLVVQANDGGTVNADIQRNEFSNNVNPATGARLEAFSGILNVLAFNENMIQDNNGNGVVFHSDDTGLGAGLIQIFDMNNNLITGNGVGTMENAEGTNNNGVYMLADNGSAILADLVNPAGFGLVPMGLTDNTIDSNFGAGMLVNAENGGVIFLDILPGEVGNTFDTNMRDGLFFDLDTGGMVAANILGSSFSNNGGFGIGAFVNDGSELQANIGDRMPGQGNTIDSNVGAGIGFIAEDFSIISTSIVGNFITRNTDDGDMFTPFAGDGVGIVIRESRLENSTIDFNAIGDLMDDTLGNEGNGVLITATGALGSSGIFNLLIGNGDGIDNDNGNQIGNNGLDGVRIVRDVSATISNVNVWDNKIWSNVGNGVRIINRGNDNVFNTFDITHNWIFDNGVNGIFLTNVSDANMRVDIIENLIDDNTANGISTSEIVNTAFDNRSLTGTWSDNEITNNGASGIQLSAISGGILIEENDILRNTLDGVRHSSAGTYLYDDNMISQNGEDGVDISGPGFKAIGFTDNVISENAGDGLEVLNDDGNTGPFSSTIVGMGNEITLNQGRGIDVLNRGDAELVFNFDDTTVTDNLLEGVYVVNTASAVQNQSNAAGAAFDDTGDNTIEPLLDFTFSNGEITGNGTSSAFEATGLLIRVGTSDRFYSQASPYALDGHGGVIARVFGNTMTGNLGSDVYFDSFVSAEESGDTQNDPLARLDLLFSGNTVGQLDASNTGAFYNNASPTKSPWDTDRLRNAQRIEGNFNWEAVISDTTPANNQFDVVDRVLGTYGGATDSLNDWVLTIVEGPLIGQFRTITDSSAGGTLDFAVPFGGVPANGTNVDVFFTDIPGTGGSTFRVDLGIGNAIGSTVSGFTDPGFTNPNAPLGAIGTLNGEFDFGWDIDAGLFP